MFFKGEASGRSIMLQWKAIQEYKDRTNST